MRKKPMKPDKKLLKVNPGGADRSKPPPVPDGTARSASYAISFAVHILVLLVIFVSAQFINSAPEPEPQKKYQEVVLQFDMGVPGSQGDSVMETENPDEESPVDSPDQGRPEVVETPPEPPEPETPRQPEPEPAQPRPQVEPHPNPAHQPEPATETPDQPEPQPNEADNPWAPDDQGGEDSQNTPSDQNGDGDPSPGDGPQETGRPSLPGSVPSQPGWCRTKDDQNNPNAVYSYQGGSYRCNCTLGQNVTCYLVN